MKKKLIIFLLLFCLSFISFSSTLNEYIFIFDNDKLIDSNKVELNTLGFYLKFLETSNSQYRTTANVLRSENYNKFSSDESFVFDILSEIRSSQEFLRPKRLFDEGMNNYSDSVIIKLMYIRFAYNQWSNDGKPETAKKILDTIDNLEQQFGLTPYTTFYKSNILWYSRAFQNKDEAYKILVNTVNKYPDNKNTIELLFKIAFESKDFDLIESYYYIYKNFSNRNATTMFFIANAFKNLNQIEKTRELLIWITENTNSANLLASSYELLGDISTTLAQKENFYSLALTHASENPRILGKYGMVLYQIDRDENMTAARIFLNKAISGYSNQPEAEAMLKEIRRRVAIRTLTFYILPILGVVALGIFGLLYYEKKRIKKIKNEEKISGEDNNE